MPSCGRNSISNGVLVATLCYMANTAAGEGALFPDLVEVGRGVPVGALTCTSNDLPIDSNGDVFRCTPCPGSEASAAATAAASSFACAPAAEYPAASCLGAGWGGWIPCASLSANMTGRPQALAANASCPFVVPGESSHPPQLAVDGDPSTFWQSPVGVNEVDFTIDLGVETVRGCHLCQHSHLDSAAAEASPHRFLTNPHARGTVGDQRSSNQLCWTGSLANDVATEAGHDPRKRLCGLPVLQPELRF